MNLNNKNIDIAVENIQKFFESVNVSNKDKIKLCFLFEESLLRYQEKFGEDIDFEFITKKWLGTPKVLIKIKGKPYNPLENDNDEQIFSENIMRNLLKYDQAKIVYSYENGYNELHAISTKKAKKIKIPGGSNTIAIFFALIFAFILKNFSQDIQNDIVEYIISPILNTLFGAIIAANIPLIFISIVASICGIEDVTTLNKIGSKVLKKFASTIFFVVLVTIPICLIIYPVLDLKIGGNFLTNNTHEVQQIFDLILSIVPQNIIEPFSEGKILQIVVVALVTGFCVTILGEKVTEFKKLVMDLKQLIFEVVHLIMKVIPIVIFLCISKTLLQYSFGEILSFWKIIVADYLAYFIIASALLIKNYIKYKMNIIEFLKKIYPACLITFTTASGTASMPKNIEICKKELKIPGELCEFFIPLSHALCPTTMLIGFLNYTFFAAEFSGVQITLTQMLIIIFLSVQFAAMSSSIGTGFIAILSLLLTQLDLSLDAIGIIVASDIFIVNFSGVISLVIRDCNLFDLSHKIKID